MSTRSNLIKNRGLITHENELSVEEGSLRQATNVNVDEQGVVTPRRGFNDYGGPTNGLLAKEDAVKQLFEYKDRIIRHFSDKLEFEDQDGNFQSISGIYNELVEGYRIKSQESKGNLYFTTNEGIKKISVKNNNSFSTTSTVTVDQAGVPKASYIEAESIDTIGGFLPANSKVGYRFLFGTKDASNNLLLGSPSARFVLTNSNQDSNVFEEFVLQINSNTSNVSDSDYVIIPTLNSRTTFYFDVSGSASEPLNSSTLGTTFVKVDISTLNVTTDQDAIAVFLANSASNNLAEYDVTVSGNQITLISNEQGNIDNSLISTSNAGAVTENSRVEGSITKGSESNAEVTVIIPDSIDTEYFFQVYRTNFLTATLGLDLSDIDPGDEMNLVYESGLTQPEITSGKVTFTDSTPESFRASAVPLYTNAITGQGILQANDPPPIALDLDLFRNSVFYANTKSTHRTEFTIISVDDYVNGSTQFIVANGEKSRYYTAAAAETPNTDEGGDFKLSTSPSVGQAIDETARSLVKIINQDSDSPVNAYYLSGVEDLPGQILLEAKSLIDDEFFIAVEEDSFPAIGEEFSPELPLSREITSFTGLGATTEITLNSHGFVDGDIVTASYNQDLITDPESFSGKYTVSNSMTNTFEIDEPTTNAVVNFMPTNSSAVFKSDIISDNLEAPNRLYYSKRDLPEAVPSANFINVGAQDEPIRRILSLRDNLFVLKDDGVFIVSGTSAPNFSVRQTDNTKIIAPDSAVVLNNQIYCLTEQGISRINGSGQVGVISRGIENLVDAVSNASFDFSPNTFGVSYENDRAYILFMPSNKNDNSSTQAFRFNIFEQTWTQWEYDATCGHVLNRDAKLYLGNGERNFISQERKLFNRTDHSDRDFDVAVVPLGVTKEVVQLSSTQEIEISDVLVQTQEVSIYYLNSRLLRRMDEFDTGVPVPASSTMVESFGAKSRDNMAAKIQSLNDYLFSLDPTNITDKIINSANVVEQIAILTLELNSSDTITSLKDYKNPEVVSFEAYIIDIDKSKNLVTLHMERPLVDGPITVYKHFPQIIEWNPQHFGDPAALKQVREVTIIFDQNNFYDAKARFASDVAQNLVDVDFQGKGIGYWGDMDFDNPNAYWGGEGNDIPFRTIVPRGKQRCRYITLVFEHRNAREEFRILGITGVVRAISSRAYK